jgi:DNA-binding response OmpR family regulator
VEELGILIVDDDEQGRRALHHVLDAEGWRVRVVPMASAALAELAGGSWHLVIANIALTGLDSPLFTTLKELARAPAVPEETPDAAVRRARVLFLIPELAAEELQPVLEREGLPYAVKPFHLHDFLEKVSDLLLETRAIEAPIRRVKQSAAESERRREERREGRERRKAEMFSSRKDYTMTEEELAEFERQEEEARRRAKEKGEH